MWPIILLLFLSPLPKIEGNLEDLEDVGSYLDDLMDQLILHIAELVREGLLDAKVDSLVIPSFDWIIDVENLKGVFKLREMVMFGLPDFTLQNVSTSLKKRKVELILQLPLIGLKGYYDFHAKFVGVPIWGRGPFTTTFTKLEAAGGLQINPADPDDVTGTLFLIKVFTPFLSLGQLDLVLEGLMGQLSPRNLILIIVTILIGYTMVVLVVKFFIRKLIGKIKKKWQI